MSDPVVFRVVRPYQNLEEFLEAEARWLQRFGIDLATGESVIRAEGRVIEYVGRKDASPGGLKIRFKRYGASTKSVLDRAAEGRSC